MVPGQARPRGVIEAITVLDNTCGRIALAARSCPSLIINPSNVAGAFVVVARRRLRIGVELRAVVFEKMLKAELGIVRRQPSL